MACLTRKLVAIGMVTLAVFLASPALGAGSEGTRIVRPSARQGEVAVFKPSRAVATSVVGGELLVGRSRTPLTPRQIRAIGGQGILRVHIGRRSARIALALRFDRRAAKTGNGGNVGGGGNGNPGEPIGVAPAVPATIPSDPAYDPLAGGRLYSASSPFNQRLPVNPAIAPDSAQQVQGLVRAEAQKGFVLTVGEWTVPTYFADASTPDHSVTLGAAPPQWGLASNSVAYPPGSTSGLPTQLPGQLREVPIPNGAQPDPSLDAHMTIIDRAANCEYDLYGAYRSADGWHAVWANSTRLDSTGVYPFGMGTKASGFAGVAGLIWPQELRAGEIDHALFFAYPFTKSGGPVSPATSSDGRVESAEALPEGARVQLDPSLDLDTLDLRPYQRTIAEAMQTYGMILGDTGGAFGIYAVGRQGFTGNPYQGILPEEDFPDLSGIPADRFRVLNLPPQQSQPQLQIAASGCGSFD